jgi:hypothetical protein
MWFLTELLGTKAALAFATSAPRHTRDRTSVLPREHRSKQQALRTIDTRAKPGKE